MRAMRKIVAVILGAVIIFPPTIAEAKKIKLKLTYDNRVKLRLISLNFNSELDFMLNGNNISVYNPQNGGKFIGWRQMSPVPSIRVGRRPVRNSPWQVEPNRSRQLIDCWASPSLGKRGYIVAVSYSTSAR